MTPSPARLGALVGALAVGACAGPPTGPEPGAPFQDALALGATPDGRLWVVDGATGVLVVLRDGLVVDRWGGAGTGDDAFLDPVDVDPTNGQAVFVADRAGGAVHQLTAEGRVAVSLPVPDVDPSRPLREVRPGAARARPLAVAAAPDGTLWVLDGARRHVLRLSREGDVERVLTGLADPVDLALDDDGTLWVADAGRGALRSFDAFGTPGRSVEVPGLGRLVGVAAEAGEVVALTASMGVHFRDGAERLFWRDEPYVRDDGTPPGPDGVYEPFRDVALVDGGVVALLPTRLSAVGGGDLD